MSKPPARSAFERLVARAVRRPLIPIAVVAVLAVVGGLAGARLEADAGTETLLDRDSGAFRATEQFRRSFGDDAAVVLVRAPLRRLLTGDDLRALFELETCLAGGTDLAAQLESGPAKPLPRVCGQIAELAPARGVYGPASFLYQSALRINTLLASQTKVARREARAAALAAAERAQRTGGSPDAAARKASERVLGEYKAQLARLALTYGITGPPRLDDPRFVQAVVFDQGASTPRPKARFAQLFPSNDAAQITIRPRPGLTDSERDRMVSLYRRAIEDPRFALSRGDYVLSGAPPLVGALTEAIRSQLLVLLGVSALVMALTLFLLLSPPLRLLPLAVALAAAGTLFGGISLLGGKLTIAAVAMLPVLVGLAVDYAIQFQARFAEERANGLDPPAAAVEAAGGGGPVLGLACLASMAGFAAFALAASPLVRSFGILLVAGIALAFVIAVWAGLAALSSVSRGGGPGRSSPPRTLVRSGLVAGPVRRIGRIAIRTCVEMPGRVLVAAILVAACGWVAAARTPVDADVRDLAPSNLGELRDLRALERTTGISGEIDVLVSGKDLAAPATLAWMSDFRQRVLARHGFSGPSPRCERADLCPAPSLPDLFGDAAGAVSKADAEAVVREIPPYLSKAVVTRTADGDLGEEAAISFGVRIRPLAKQERLIADIRRQVNPPGGPAPPPGVKVRVAGLQVLVSDANSSLEAARWWLPLVGIAAVALVLLAAWRSPARVSATLVPVLLATGWSGLAVSALQVPLNPMSATLGALVIAVATEFSIILGSRYREERQAGLDLPEALRAAYSRSGAAVVASGVTVTAGFAVLALAGPAAALGLPSVAPILSDFGLVTVVDLAVALVGVLLVLPAAIAWHETRLPELRSRPRPVPPGPAVSRPQDVPRG